MDLPLASLTSALRMLRQCSLLSTSAVVLLAVSRSLSMVTFNRDLELETSEVMTAWRMKGTPALRLVEHRLGLLLPDTAVTELRMSSSMA